MQEFNDVTALNELLCEFGSGEKRSSATDTRSNSIVCGGIRGSEISQRIITYLFRVTQCHDSQRDREIN